MSRVVSRVRRRAAIGVAVLGVLVLTGCLEHDVRVLSSEAMGGRVPGTPGSTLAQDHIIDELQRIGAGPATGASGRDGYRQPFATGTNVVGVIPGTDLADEYVVVGAHYDHVASCRQVPSETRTCNGATDNATGAAAVLAVGRDVAASRPRRSVVLALWDHEEGGLRGARHYVANPLVPLADTAAYVNMDILGANLRASLRGDTFAVGSESGGSALVDLVTTAAAPSTLDVRVLSRVYGQDRSDHAAFLGAQVPSVFLSDSTGPCYHTSGDVFGVVDLPKLHEQVGVVRRITRALADADVRPTYTAAPTTVYSDAVALHEVVTRALADPAGLGLTPAQLQQVEAAHASLGAVVAAGADGFTAARSQATLVAAANVVNLLTAGPCAAFTGTP